MVAAASFTRLRCVPIAPLATDILVLIVSIGFVNKQADIVAEPASAHSSSSGLGPALGGTVAGCEVRGLNRRDPEVRPFSSDAAAAAGAGARLMAVCVRAWMGVA